MKGKKPKDAAQPPAPLTDREQRARQLPTFKGNELLCTPELLENTCDLLKVDHQGAALDVIAQALKGKDADNTSTPDHCKNIALQQLAELKPESYLESMLLAQMVQVSNAAGKCMERAFLLEGQTIPAKEMNANLAIKFQRTFVAQIEALQKLRGKGGQKVTVEHVHVHEGGQAIVGNVNHAPGGGGKNER